MTEIDTLLGMLSSPDRDIRQDAVEQLGGFDDDRAKEALKEMLHDPEFHVRIAAVESIEAISDISAVPNLIAALNDRTIFGSVVFTLYDIAMANDMELPGVRELLKSDDSLLRLAAAYVMAEKGGVDAILGLIDLVRIGISGDKPEFEHAVRALIAIGRSTVPALLNVFAEKNESLIRMAISVLGELRDPRAIPHLRAVLNDFGSEGYVRVEAAWALTEIGTPEALEAVEKWQH